MACSVTLMGLVATRVRNGKWFWVPIWQRVEMFGSGPAQSQIFSERGRTGPAELIFFWFGWVHTENCTTQQIENNSELRPITCATRKSDLTDEWIFQLYKGEGWAQSPR